MSAEPQYKPNFDAEREMTAEEHSLLRKASTGDTEALVELLRRRCVGVGPDWWALPLSILHELLGQAVKLPARAGEQNSPTPEFPDHIG